MKVHWAGMEALAAIARTGGFDAAAQVLRLSTSAVSQRVSGLERSLGLTLVNRERPVSLTAAGQRVLRHVDSVKLLETELLDDLGLGQRPMAVSLGVNADSLATWVAPALAPWMRRHWLELRIEVEDQTLTHRLLTDGRVQACVSAREDGLPGCIVRPLGRMRYRLVCSPGFRQRWFSGGIDTHALSRAPALVFNRKDTMHNRFLDALLGVSGFRFPAHKVPASESFPQWARHGLGYGLIAEAQVQTLLDGGQLVDLLPGRTDEVPLFWHRWKVAPAVVLDLEGALVQAAGRQLR